MAGKSKYTFDSRIHVYRATRPMLLAYSIAQVFGVTIEDLFEFREA